MLRCVIRSIGAQYDELQASRHDDERKLESSYRGCAVAVSSVGIQFSSDPNAKPPPIRSEILNGLYSCHGISRVEPGRASPHRTVCEAGLRRSTASRTALRPAPAQIPGNAYAGLQPQAYSESRSKVVTKDFATPLACGERYCVRRGMKPISWANDQVS